ASAEALLEALAKLEAHAAVVTRTNWSSLPLGIAFRLRTAAKSKYFLATAVAAGLILIGLVGLLVGGIVRVPPSHRTTVVPAKSERIVAPANAGGDSLRPFSRMAMIRTGQWSIEGNQLLQVDSQTPFPDIYFGDFEWTDYDFSFQTRRTAGNDLFALHC